MLLDKSSHHNHPPPLNPYWYPLYPTVPLLYPDCTPAVPWLYPCCTSAVSSLYPYCILAVSWLYPDCILTWSGCILTVSWLYPDCILTVSRLYPHCILTVSSLYPGCILTVSWLYPHCILTVSLSLYPLLSSAWRMAICVFSTISYSIVISFVCLIVNALNPCKVNIENILMLCYFYAFQLNITELQPYPHLCTCMFVCLAVWLHGSLH